MRCGTLVSVLAGFLVFEPLPAGSQTRLDATFRTRNQYYAAGGGFVAFASGSGADAALMGGRVLSEHLLVGLEAGYAYRDDSDSESSSDGQDADPEVQYLFVDAVASWFPSSQRGAFIKGGLGFGAGTEEWDGTTREHDFSGVTALAAAGWEFPIGERAGFAIEAGAVARPGFDDIDPRMLLTLVRYWGLRQ